MKHLILGTSAIGATILSAALFGAGVAVAGDYDGQTYADAAAAIEESGNTPVIATRVGSQLPTDECLVMNSQDQAFLRDPPDDVYMLPVTDEVRVNLNCAGPAGREAEVAAEEAAAAE